MWESWEKIYEGKMVSGTYLVDEFYPQPDGCMGPFRKCWSVFRWNRKGKPGLQAGVLFRSDLRTDRSSRLFHDLCLSFLQKFPVFKNSFQMEEPVQKPSSSLCFVEYSLLSGLRCSHKAFFCEKDHWKRAGCFWFKRTVSGGSIL